MIASRLRLGDVACAVVGADRIAANGDTANKIGTYALALAARAHGVPLYVLAPTSTIDPATPDGAAIPIEERSPDEMAGWRGQRTAPDGMAGTGVDVAGRRRRHHHRPRHRPPTGSAGHRLHVVDPRARSGTTGSTAGGAPGWPDPRRDCEFTQYYPEPGWVSAAGRDLYVSRGRCEAVSACEGVVARITNQRETVVLWDRRTLCRRPPTSAGSPHQRCCREPAPARAAARSRPAWSDMLLRHQARTLLRDPALRRRAERGELAAGTVEAGWWRGSLAGEFTQRPATHRTLLYDLRRRAWDEELLALFRVPREVLPTIVPSAGVVGDAQTEHLGFALPIAGRAGDQQAALFGQGCCEVGLAKNTYGTGAFLLVYRGTSAPHLVPGILATAACGPRGEPAYALEGSVFVAGAAVQWLRDGLGLIARAEETDALARSVADTGGVHFVPAFVGLGTPHWEPEARGTITGLTRGTSRAQLVRAALEAIAFSSAELLAAMAGAEGCRSRAASGMAAPPTTG
jgi:glycerol kinase